MLILNVCIRSSSSSSDEDEVSKPATKRQRTNSLAAPNTARGTAGTPSCPGRDDAEMLPASTVVNKDANEALRGEVKQGRLPSQDGPSIEDEAGCRKRGFQQMAEESNGLPERCQYEKQGEGLVQQDANLGPGKGQHSWLPDRECDSDKDAKLGSRSSSATRCKDQGFPVLEECS